MRDLALQETAAASGLNERILSDDHIGEERMEAETPESIAPTTPDDATLAELLTAFETLRREAISPTALPIRPHATRLPSPDRAVSLLFLAAVRRFYGTHGVVQCSETVCGDGYTTPESSEECDDHNTADGDGCSASCQLEALPDGFARTLSQTWMARSVPRAVPASVPH